MGTGLEYVGGKVNNTYTYNDTKMAIITGRFGGKDAAAEE
jgi:hypothetical protein